MYGHGLYSYPALPFPYPRLACRLAFPLHRDAAQQKKALKQLKPVHVRGYGGTAAPLRLRLVLVDLSGRSTVRTCTQDRLPARDGRGVLSRYRLLAQTGSCLSSRAVSRPIRPLFALVSTVTSVCVLLSNSLNAWPVSCLACRPPALAYISRLSRPESRPPLKHRSAVASSSFLFLFLFVIVHRERDQLVWQWLCFLDVLPPSRRIHRPLAPSPDDIYPSCWQELPVPVVCLSRPPRPGRPNLPRGLKRLPSWQLLSGESSDAGDLSCPSPSA